MRKLILIFFMACGSDVSIMKRADEETSVTDSAATTDTTGEQTDDSSDTEDPQTDLQSDLVVGFVEYTLVQASCPPCFGLPNEITSYKYARFHEPTGGDHYSWVPREDEFCRNYYNSPVTANNTDIGTSLVFTSTAGQSYLNKTSDGTGIVYREPDVYTDGAYSRDTEYEILVDGILLSDEKFKSLHGFDYVEPYTMLYVDPSYAFQTPINKTSNYFTWGPSGDADSFFTIHISVYTPDGASYLGTTICRGLDTGSMVFPGSYFVSYPSGSLTSIHLIRHRTKDVYSTALDGVIQTHMWWEVIGTGYIQ